jgi:hypothetical protein
LSGDGKHSVTLFTSERTHSGGNWWAVELPYLLKDDGNGVRCLLRLVECASSHDGNPSAVLGVTVDGSDPASQSTTWNVSRTKRTFAKTV